MAEEKDLLASFIKGRSGLVNVCLRMEMISPW